VAICRVSTATEATNKEKKKFQLILQKSRLFSKNICSSQTAVAEDISAPCFINLNKKKNK
jgi:hypothetical protein